MTYVMPLWCICTIPESGDPFPGPLSITTLPHAACPPLDKCAHWFRTRRDHLILNVDVREASGVK